MVGIWRYAAANALAAGNLDVEDLRDVSVLAARAVSKFFAKPTEKKLKLAAGAVQGLHSKLQELSAGVNSLPLQRVPFQASVGTGLPFPVSMVVVPSSITEATLQLKNGWAMPLLGMALSQHQRPSIEFVTNSLRRGLRHLEVPPSTATAAGTAIKESRVPRKSLFISVPWTLPLRSEQEFVDMLKVLRTRHVDLVYLVRSSEPITPTWELLLRLKESGRIRALGVRGMRPEELARLTGGENEVQVAQCGFTPHRPGPHRDAWHGFGSRSIVFVATGLFTDWPYLLKPMQDPHLIVIAERIGRSPVQVLLRWALQVGLAVVFRTASLDHLAENLQTLEFNINEGDIQLISSLVTLADPTVPPGDGFAHVYDGSIGQARDEL